MWPWHSLRWHFKRFSSFICRRVIKWIYYFYSSIGEVSKVTLTRDESWLIRSVTSTWVHIKLFVICAKLPVFHEMQRKMCLLNSHVIRAKLDVRCRKVKITLTGEHENVNGPPPLRISTLQSHLQAPLSMTEQKRTLPRLDCSYCFECRLKKMRGRQDTSVTRKV